MKNKMIVVMSLVAAGVMTLSHVLRIDEGFSIIFLGSYLQDLNHVQLIREGLKLVSDVKKKKEFENEKSDSLSFYWTITSGMVGRKVYRMV